jgi:hypothetical protein
MYKKPTLVGNEEESREEEEATYECSCILLPSRQKNVSILKLQYNKANKPNSHQTKESSALPSLDESMSCNFVADEMDEHCDFHHNYHYHHHHNLSTMTCHSSNVISINTAHYSSSSTTSSSSASSSPTNNSQHSGIFVQPKQPSQNSHHFFNNNEVSSSSCKFIPPSMLSTPNQQDSLNKCLRCGQQVYALEQVGPIKGVVYHKTCFKCLICDRQLDLNTYYTNQVDLSDRQIYCKSHAPKHGKGALGSDSICIHSLLSAPKLNVVQKVYSNHKVISIVLFFQKLYFEYYT